MNNAPDRYLFAVQMLKETYPCVRSVDVAHYLGVSKAAVSTALRQLREQELMEVEPDGNLVFTAKGKTHSERLRTRVLFFQQLLTRAGVEPSLAMRDAISFSWEMSDDSFEAFRNLMA